MRCERALNKQPLSKRMTPSQRERFRSSELGDSSRAAMQDVLCSRGTQRSTVAKDRCLSDSKTAPLRGIAGYGQAGRESVDDGGDGPR